MKYVSKGVIILTLLTIITFVLFLTKETKSINYDKVASNIVFTASNTGLSKNYIDKEIERKKSLVYKDMTIEELSAKLNKSLNSTIANKGDIIAKHSIAYGVDPYVATAIILYETGCKWTCSYLVQTCNNVGGVKGTPSCNGSYQRYSTIDEGIEQFISNLYYNYYNVGLTTVEQINTKYTSNTAWSQNVYNYINYIESN